MRWVLVNKDGYVCEQVPDKRDDVRDIMTSWIDMFDRTEGPFVVLEVEGKHGRK